MDDSWANLPTTAVLVCAGILTPDGALAAEAPNTEASTDEAQPPSDQLEQGDPEAEPDPYEPEPVAPTCGPCCHGQDCSDDYYGYAGGPSPLPPRNKTGCAISEPGGYGVMLSTLPLLALGVGFSRRRE